MQTPQTKAEVEAHNRKQDEKYWQGKNRKHEAYVDWLLDKLTELEDEAATLLDDVGGSQVQNLLLDLQWVRSEAHTKAGRKPEWTKEEVRDKLYEWVSAADDDEYGEREAYADGWLDCEEPPLTEANLETFVDEFTRSS